MPWVKTSIYVFQTCCCLCASLFIFVFTNAFHDNLREVDSLSLPLSSLLPSPRKYNLFIFGYGNVGSSVANLASQVRYSIDDSTSSQRIFGVSVQDFHSGATNDLPSTSIPVFQSICATVRNLNTISLDLSESKTETNMKTQIPSIRLVEFNNYETVVAQLTNATHVLITIPPTPSTTQQQLGQQAPAYVDPVLSSHCYIDCIPQHAWVGYVSTTGVYGNHDGEWVNESSEARVPSTTTKAYAYLQIESQWQRLAQQRHWDSCYIFRCAGLYGKRSSALHTAWKQISSDGRKNNLEGGSVEMANSKEFVTSRIHLYDVSRAIVLAMMQAHRTMEMTFPDSTQTVSCTINNLADNEPAQRSIVMEYAQNLLAAELEQDGENAFFKTVEGNEQPHASPLEAVTNSSKSSERRKRQASDSKRVSNAKLLDLLRPYGGLLYPSYREGLLSILQCGRKE